VTDSGGRLHGYVEIWVQSLRRPFRLSGSRARSSFQPRLDDRWSKLFEAYAALDDQPARGAASSTHRFWNPCIPAPCSYDSEKREIIIPSDAFSGIAWKLCTDDALLAPRASALFLLASNRYLVADAKSPLIPQHPTLPHPQPLRPLTEITGPKKYPLSAEPGRMLLVREYAPAPLEPFY